MHFVVTLWVLAILSAYDPNKFLGNHAEQSKMMFELVAAAVVAAFVSCLHRMIRDLFRELEEMPVSRLVKARRSVKKNPVSKSVNW